MQLQVFAILENGVSKLLPRQSDTLRVLLILPDATNGRQAETEGMGARPAPERRRRVMASLASGVA